MWWLGLCLPLSCPVVTFNGQKSSLTDVCLDLTISFHFDALVCDDDNQPGNISIWTQDPDLMDTTQLTPLTNF